jgi:hypothetical protein
MTKSAIFFFAGRLIMSVRIFCDNLYSDILIFISFVKVCGNTDFEPTVIH